MTPNKANFRKKYENDLSCILCEDPLSIENLQHLLVCSFSTNQPQLSGELQITKCEDIYGNLSDQVRSVKTWESSKFMTKRKKSQNKLIQEKKRKTYSRKENNKPGAPPNSVPCIPVDFQKY